MDTLQFAGPPEDYLFADGMYHCKSCIPKVDVKTDGVDHEVAGYSYDTLAVRILDDHAVKFTMKKATELFQPAVILVVALVVGFIAVAQVAAMYSIFGQVK